jgi:hypothetical protein
VLEIKSQDLKILGSQGLTELLEKLLLLEAKEHGIDAVKIKVSKNLSSTDGGIDGSIEVPPLPDRSGYLFAGKMVFQVKATDMPPKKCVEEILRHGYIKPYIEKLIEIKDPPIQVTYVLFNNREINDYHIKLRIDAIREAFLKGIKARINLRVPRIEIYDSTRICNWANKYLSAIKFVWGHSGRTLPVGIMAWEDLGARKGYAKKIFDGPDNKFLGYKQRVIDNLLYSHKKVQRISGSSGLGKSRIVYEIFRRPDENKEEKMQTMLHQTSVYVDANLSVYGEIEAHLAAWIQKGISGILIVDNCDAELHHQLSNCIQSKKSNISLLTVGHEKASNEDMILQRMDDETLREIITDLYPILTPADVKQIVKFSHGFPGIADLLSKAQLQSGSFYQLSDSQFINKLLWGDIERNEKAYEVILACSLFSWIGVKDNRENQYEFIANVFCNLNPVEFYKLIKRYFFERGVIAAVGRYFIITHEPLAWSLAANWWSECHPTQALKFVAAIFDSSAPEGLKLAFLQRLEKLSFSVDLRQFLIELCKPDGFLSLGRNFEKYIELIATITDIVPDAVLNLLKIKINHLATKYKLYDLYLMSNLPDQKDLVNYCNAYIFIKNDPPQLFYVSNNDSSKRYLSKVRATLANTTSTIELEEYEIEPDDDCGFTTLGTDRKTLADKLLSLKNNAQDREFLSEEILNAFDTYRITRGNEGLKPDSSKVEDLLQERDNTQQSLDKLRRQIENNSQKSFPDFFSSETITPSLLGKMPNSNIPIEFEEYPVPPDGNCGFTALGVNRQQLVKVLLSLENDLSARMSLAKVIENALRSRDIKSPDREGQDLIETIYVEQKNLDELFRKTLDTLADETTKRLERNQLITWLQNNNRENEAQELSKHRLALHQVERRLEVYCQSQAVFKHYIQLFDNTPLWLDYKSALLYAEQTNIKLHIWKKEGGNSSRLTLIESHEVTDKTNTTEKEIHMLFTGGFTHYNLLIKKQAEDSKSLANNSGHLPKEGIADRDPKTLEKAFIEQRLKVSQAENEVLRYHTRPEVFEYYVNAYCDTSGGRRLWLGYKSALLYAKQMNMALHIWRKSVRIPNQLELITSQDGNGTGTPEIHMLHTKGFTHFNLLSRSKRAPFPKVIELKIDTTAFKRIDTKSIENELIPIKGQVSDEILNKFWEVITSNDDHIRYKHRLAGNYIYLLLALQKLCCKKVIVEEALQLLKIVDSSNNSKQNFVELINGNLIDHTAVEMTSNQQLLILRILASYNDPLGKFARDKLTKLIVSSSNDISKLKEVLSVCVEVVKNVQLFWPAALVEIEVLEYKKVLYELGEISENFQPKRTEDELVWHVTYLYQVYKRVEELNLMDSSQLKDLSRNIEKAIGVFADKYVKAQAEIPNLQGIYCCPQSGGKAFGKKLGEISNAKNDIESIKTFLNNSLTAIINLKSKKNDESKIDLSVLIGFISFINEKQWPKEKRWPLELVVEFVKKIQDRSDTRFIIYKLLPHINLVDEYRSALIQDNECPISSLKILIQKYPFDKEKNAKEVMPLIKNLLRASTTNEHTNAKLYAVLYLLDRCFIVLPGIERNFANYYKTFFNELNGISLRAIRAISTSDSLPKIYDIEPDCLKYWVNVIQQCLCPKMKEDIINDIIRLFNSLDVTVDVCKIIEPIVTLLNNDGNLWLKVREALVSDVKKVADNALSFCVNSTEMKHFISNCGSDQLMDWYKKNGKKILQIIAQKLPLITDDGYWNTLAKSFFEFPDQNLNNLDLINLSRFNIDGTKQRFLLSELLQKYKHVLHVMQWAQSSIQKMANRAQESQAGIAPTPKIQMGVSYAAKFIQEPNRKFVSKRKNSDYEEQDDHHNKYSKN